VAAVEAIVAAEAVLRERVAGVTAALFRICADVGCDDITREKSSPMFRAAWQPDISSNPTPTVCVIRPLIVIPSSKHVAKSIEDTYGPGATQPPFRTPQRRIANGGCS
jgi:hypothetical protein